jgi:hypothetical protein
VTSPRPNADGDRAYKRSWKNLLINKRYQLRFTLFMVGLSTLLICGLGVWVMRVANETTAVSMASVRGTPCPRIPTLSEVAIDPPAEPAAPTRAEEPDLTPPPAAPASEAEAADASADTGADAAADDDGSRKVTVQIDESSMQLMPVAPKVPEDFATRVVAHWTCELRLDAKIEQLERGRMTILWVLIGTGLVLVVGLALYGLKMTHRVAGPLFKVSLYLAKMRDGRFDKVWNLRKGDQLVEFYEHFRMAHAGIVQMEKDDIARIKAVIAAAEAAGAGDLPTVQELRDLLVRKEKSIE